MFFPWIAWPVACAAGIGGVECLAYCFCAALDVSHETSVLETLKPRIHCFDERSTCFT